MRLEPQPPNKDLANTWLFALVGSDELVETWWNSPNKFWNNQTPQTVWNKSPNEVMSYLKRFL